MNATDFKYRIFVDTNILIDATVTPDEEVVNFLTKAASNENIELVTSDYALWEKNNFVRMQSWLQHNISKGRSYKEAINHKMKVDEELMTLVEKSINDFNTQLQDTYKITNFNLMDVSTSQSDFYVFLKKLTYSSAISNQDLLILLSAYETQSTAILTKDGRFKGGFDDTKAMQEKLTEAFVPDTLKNVKFIDCRIDPQAQLKDWFDNKIKQYSIFKVEDEVFQNPNALAIEPSDKSEVKVGDHLCFMKVGDEATVKHMVKVENGNLRDYNSKQAIQSGNHVTLKFPDEVLVGDVRNSFVFRLE